MMKVEMMSHSILQYLTQPSQLHKILEYYILRQDIALKDAVGSLKVRDCEIQSLKML